MNNANMTLGEVADKARALQKEFSDSVVLGMNVQAYSFRAENSVDFRIQVCHKNSGSTLGNGESFAEAEADLRKNIAPESMLARAEKLEQQARALRAQAAQKDLLQPAIA